MQTDDVLEVDIDALSFGGEGIGRVDSFVLFVPRGVPGDKLLVRIVSLKKRYGSSRIVRILKASPIRVASRCELFSAGGGEHLGCGGCQWMHIDYDEQLKWKRRFVEDAFSRIGGVTVDVSEIIAAENSWESRNKLSASMGNDGAVGLCIEHSPVVLPIRSCPMEMGANNVALSSFLRTFGVPPHSNIMREMTQIHFRATPDGSTSLGIYTTRTADRLRGPAEALVKEGGITAVGAVARRRFAHLAGKRSLFAKSGRINYELPIDTFFQTNYEQAETLLDAVRDGLQPKEGDTLLDLYAGIGYFGLDVGLDGVRITAVEEHPAAIAAAERTARRLKIKGNFIRGRVDGALFSSGQLETRYDLVVLDPPRSGCGPEVAAAIASLAPRRIVYVSCSPPTLARDVEAMNENGYRVVACIPIDMFPQTYHVEAVTVLERT